jgi:hypothetical protein
VKVDPTDAVSQVFDYGYRTNIDDPDSYSSNTIYSQSITNIGLSGNTNAYNTIISFGDLGTGTIISPSNFTENSYTYTFDPTNLPSKYESIKEFSNQSFTFKVGYGDNTINYEQSSKSTIQGTSPSLPKLYTVSSLGNTNENEYAESLNSSPVTCSITRYNNSVTVKGVHPIYTNGNLIKMSSSN